MNTVCTCDENTFIKWTEYILLKAVMIIFILLTGHKTEPQPSMPETCNFLKVCTIEVCVFSLTFF